MNFYGCFYHYETRKTPTRKSVDSEETTTTTNTESQETVITATTNTESQETNSLLSKVESFVDFETKKELVEDIVDHSVDMIEDINDIKEKYADYQRTHNEKDIVEIENDARKVVQDGEVIYSDAKKLNWINWILGD